MAVLFVGYIAATIFYYNGMIINILMVLTAISIYDQTAYRKKVWPKDLPTDFFTHKQLLQSIKDELLSYRLLILMILLIPYLIFKPFTYSLLVLLIYLTYCSFIPFINWFSFKSEKFRKNALQVVSMFWVLCFGGFDVMFFGNKGLTHIYEFLTAPASYLNLSIIALFCIGLMVLVYFASNSAREKFSEMKADHQVQ